MHRPLKLVATLFAFSSGAAVAQDRPNAEPEMTFITADLSAEDIEIDEGLEEIGVSLGLEGAGGTTPGGAHISANYLYKMVGNEWLDAGVATIMGSNQRACFRDRKNVKQCDHGYFAGGATELSLSLRHYFIGPTGFRPFAKLGTGLRVVSLKGDDSRGYGIPLLLGGGVRARVARRIVAVGQVTARSGIAFWDNQLGSKWQWSLAFTAGVEFNLD